jgi:hypothetical protein
MADFNLDRIRFNWKGIWNTSTSYVKDDIVYYEGKAFVCLEGHTSSADDFYNDKDVAPIQTIAVTVNTDTLTSKSHGVFYFDGVETPTLKLRKGNTYIFDQTQISNTTYGAGAHPLLLSATKNGTFAGGQIYNTNIVYYLNDQLVTQDQYIADFVSSASRKFEITISDTIQELYYFSSNEADMGNNIRVKYSSYWELMFDGYTWKKDWQPDTFYPEGAIVKFHGYIYKCTNSHTSTGIAHPGLVTDILNWTLHATTYNWLNLWTTDTNYSVGDIVRYNGTTYICIQLHTSASNAFLGLEDNLFNWAIVSRTDNWRGDWSTFTRYIADDLVKYGGIVYRCILHHTSNSLAENGLEANQENWEIVNSVLEYKTEWTPDTRYKSNDVVKYGGTLWKTTSAHTSSSIFRNDSINWLVYVPGFEFESIWDIETEYQQGDIVLYGGYSYTALTTNVGTVPSINGILQDTGDWEVLTTGYKHLGDFDTATQYTTGDVIRESGYLYVALIDSVGASPNTNPTEWQLLTTGSQWRSDWHDANTYYLGDVTTIAGTAYQCILSHNSSVVETVPTTDVGNTDTYWKLLIQGSPSNVLTTQGDIKTRNASADIRLGISTPGSALKATSSDISWAAYATINNVFYVAPDGTDIPTAGIQPNAPFRTVKYACEYVQENIDNNTTQSTIFIKTGYYEEITPIKIPRNCALVGDELRSTVIVPAPGYEEINMFYVNNGSGIRNMTLQGLSGTLGSANIYLTKRPSAGAFVSLDPGEGTNDQSVWITSKSPYVQNVTTFGTGCIGMKIDGSLHDGGNRSVVANDFTQVLSDGIGYWATNLGRSELVSVFTYYNHIGYLAENGGILRATNGNNSYGEYGSVAEGYNLQEPPINGSINNRSLEAQVEEIFTYGTIAQRIIALGYSTAGQEYTSANIAFSGSGINATGSITEVRNDAITQIRVNAPGDSSVPGGLNYTKIVNSAQEGNVYSIYLSQADIGTEESYVGQRLVIISGLGVGQYGEISAFDPVSKLCVISKETDGSAGWDHFLPGWPIELLLDQTTRYSIEPKIIAEEPSFIVTSATAPSIVPWDHFTSNGADILMVTASLEEDGIGSGIYFNENAFSTNGGATFTTANYSPAFANASTMLDMLYTGDKFLALADTEFKLTLGADATTFSGGVTAPAGRTWVSAATDGAGTVVLVQDNGAVRVMTNHGGSNYATYPGVDTSTAIAGKAIYGLGKYVIVGDNGNVAYSTDNGTNWTTTVSAVSARAWNDITYGNGIFVAISVADNIVARSFDGISWYESIIEAGETLNRLTYGAGVFLASGANTQLAISQGADVWKINDEASTVYTTNQSGQWNAGIYVPSTAQFLLMNAQTGVSDGVINKISTGARPVLRTTVLSSRISSIVIYDPGSNYSTTPIITITDNLNTLDANLSVRMADGVLAQPEMTNRGTGYITALADITGDGYADIYQIDKNIAVSGLIRLPGPGDNLNIVGIDDVQYSVTAVVSSTGVGPYDAILQITPPLGIDESPDHGTAITLREQYSQIRLTGHDFLDIGTGNVNSTRYPNLYLEGEDPETPRQPFNETVASNGGRVFYTSTDQDGNFRVGELFQVEQNTGIVSINASQFNLAGLTELSLGGIQVGGSAVVIREFSKEPTFAANSNNIAPTQAAIITYLNSRISGGGSNANTNRLVAGQVQIDTTSVTSTADLQINIPVKANLKRGMVGHYLASQFYSSGSVFGLE